MGFYLDAKELADATSIRMTEHERYKAVAKKAADHAAAEIVEWMRKKAADLRQTVEVPMLNVDRDLICATEALADTLEEWIKEKEVDT